MCFLRVSSLSAALQSLFWFLYIIIRIPYISRISTRCDYQCLLFLQNNCFSLFCDIQNMTKLLKSGHQEVGSLRCKNTYRYRDDGRDTEFKLSHGPAIQIAQDRLGESACHCTNLEVWVWSAEPTQTWRETTTQNYPPTQNCPQTSTCTLWHGSNPS